MPLRNPRAPEPDDQLAQLVPGLPRAISVDAALLTRWLMLSQSAGGYGIDNDWEATAENVAELVDALADNDTALARAAWCSSPAVSATFTLRLSATVYVFGADTAHGGRICTLPVSDSDLTERAPAGNLAAAVSALSHVADLIDRAWRRTASSLWTLPNVTRLAMTGGLGLTGCEYLLATLPGTPVDEFVVPAGPIADLSYYALQTASLFAGSDYGPGPAAHTFEAYRQWRDEMGGDPPLLRDVVRRFPHTPFGVLGEWFGRDEQQRAGVDATR